MADNGSSGFSRRLTSLRLGLFGCSVKFEMYSIYVLKSLRNGKRYVGYTSKTPEERLKEHNKGDNSWTSQNGPLVLVYSEKVDNKTDAIKREKFLKSGKGREFLDSIIPR
ncbi:MAG: GIY-YIG nuclease family protein [Candidatus Omnitrophica bacterium]|nr:GIY-YIG nuclease family protein [Candidatus Omnitrophota bacterium]